MNPVEEKNPVENPLPPQQKPFSYFFNLSKALKKLGLHLPILNKSTPFCKHSTGCLDNILSGTLESFAIGYLIKTTINLLSVLLNFKKLSKQ